MATLTVVPTVTAAGAQPTDPSVIRATLVQLISADVPDYTALLPASMIEDMLSTSVAGIGQIDAAFVDLINSIAPTTANPFITNQLGQTLGIPQGLGSNASVNVVFQGSPGYVIQRGFTIKDTLGNQYEIQDGGVIATGGTTAPLYAVCPVFGSWPIPVGAVNTLVTQPAAGSGVTLTVTNPIAGTPAQTAQTEEDYRAQILLAERASAQGMQSYLKSLLQNPLVCPGVVARLVAVVQIGGGGWEVIVGGGDPYQVGYAINDALFDISLLKGSATPARNQSVNLSFYPDVYTVIFVLPPQQVVTLQVTWNTDSPNFVSPAAVSQATIPALANYINAIPVSAPINLLEMQNVFQVAIAGALDPNFLSRLVFTVSINGVAAAPAAGTAIIAGDPESYFEITPTNITVTQG